MQEHLAQHHDLSLVSLFLQADLVVKFVLLMLIGASIWTWAIVFEKVLRRGVARGEFRPIDDIEMTAILLAQPLAMHAVWLRSIAPYDDTQPVDSDRYYAAYIDFILKGLRP